MDAKLSHEAVNHAKEPYAFEKRRVQHLLETHRSNWGPIGVYLRARVYIVQHTSAVGH